MADNKGKLTSIRWSLELYNRLDEAAKDKGLNVSSYIRMVVKENLDRIEREGKR